MSSPLVFFEGVPHVPIRETHDWGVRVLDLATPPRRLSGPEGPGSNVPIRTNIDPYQTRPCPTPAELLQGPLSGDDTWSAMTKRSLARYEAYFLAAEDPQRRLDAREVVTLAHQVSLVRHVLDTPGRRRVLIGDEVGLGKTVVAGLIIKELVEANPGLRILYLAPARLVSNVGREFQRLNLQFRQWKAQESDARLETDFRVIASIHRAVHPNHLENILQLRPWDVIVVDECHHLSDWSPGGGDPVRKYRLVRGLVGAQSPEGYLLLLSGTPHQAHAARFDNLLRLLRAPGEPEDAAAGRVIYRTKEDVRDWDGNPLFPTRQVNSPIVVELDANHRNWLEQIHDFFQPAAEAGNDSVRRAAGWKCAQALQWASSSPNAGLGYLVRQALRAGWNLDDHPMREAIASLRPYRSGPPDEPLEALYRRITAEIQRQAEAEDIDDIEEDTDRLSPDVDHAALGQLIQQGIALVQAPNQLKWQRLWLEVLEPSGDEKIVMFAQPIETVMALATWLERRTGVRPSIVIGGQTDLQRDAEVARFRDRDGPRFLISSRAGGEGINLQVSRRLIHLDVPWNPMDMEQRVGRVHRFGSRQTIIVDTLVARDTRETHAWRVARDRLQLIAETLVAPDRFETVFSRVMCLIPPEELQIVLLNGPVAPLAENDVRRLSSLVEAGFREWRDFHDRYAVNQRQVREQPAGLARWSHLRDFLIRLGCGEMVEGIERTRFAVERGVVHAIDESAEVVRLSDKSLRYVGDYQGGLFTGAGANGIGPLGLNIALVAEILRSKSNVTVPTGAAHVRWSESQRVLRGQLGDEAMILAFARQIFRVNTVGGVTESGVELRAYHVRENETVPLDDDQKIALFEMQQSGTVRVRPTEIRLRERCLVEEKRLLNELRRPSEEEIRNGIRYAVWPLLALHISA